MLKQNEEIKKDQKMREQKRLNVDAWTRELKTVRTIVVDGREAILIS